MPPCRSEASTAPLKGNPPDGPSSRAEGAGANEADDGRRRFLTHLSMGDESSRGLGDGGDPAADDGRHRSMADFLRGFAGSSGPPQIVALCLLVAVALGSTIGVVPAVVADRYARLRHGYDGEAPCMDLPVGERPGECALGSDDAQGASAAASFVSNALTFLTSSLVGSISDERGRRGVMLLGLGLSLAAPAWLVLLQLSDSLDPTPYYLAHAASGVISWVAVSLSALSDVMEPAWRAPSFGLVVAGFSAGFALSPYLAVGLSHLGVSALSLGILVAAFLYACASLPETLSPDMARRARTRRLAEQPALETTADAWRYNLLRPAKELMILNRNRLFRLLSLLAFFSGIVGSADQNLFLYYVEEQYDFNDRDVARLFAVKGISGILIQTLLLKELNSRIGERRVIIVAFTVGAISNWIYGVAGSKAEIFLAGAVSSLCFMSFPTISAIKSNNVDELEQGRIQGALYSLSSLAGAIGPMTLRCVYARTKDGRGGLLHSPGTMFVFGALLYLIATFCAWLLPEEQANSNYRRSAKKRGSLVKRQHTFEYGAVDGEEGA